MVLHVKQVKRIYQTKQNKQMYPALKGIDLKVKAGDFLSIMGPSGSGKSTLLNLIATLDKPTSGQIMIEGKSVTEMSEKESADFRRQQLGFIFQDVHLLDTFKAVENIYLPLVLSGVAPNKMSEMLEPLIQPLKIKQLLNKYPNELSGGEKQRIAIARALINNPSLLLADEPTGALDSKTAQTILEDLVLINEEKKTTILMVTHSAMAASYASSVIFIKDGELFLQIHKGDQDRTTFFNQIIETLSVLSNTVSDMDISQ